MTRSTPKPTPSSPKEDRPSKFARYRARKRQEGKKLVRLWVPDPAAPGFAEEIKRQLAILRDAPEQAETLAFFEVIEAEDERGE